MIYQQPTTKLNHYCPEGSVVQLLQVNWEIFLNSVDKELTLRSKVLIVVERRTISRRRCWG